MNFASAARTPAVSRREEKKNDGGGAPIYRREGCVRLRQLPNEVATESEACHRVKKRRRRSAASSYVAASGFKLIFELFTELPLRLFCKLLTIFLKKLKISKNESCSTFQTLQLCFNEHFQILPPF